MEEIQPPLPGRPPRSATDTLRTKIWLRAVLVRSGFPSAFALEGQLEPELVVRRPEGVSRSGKWERYELGERVPTRRSGKAYAVDVAEAQYPGSRFFFESPMWQVLRGEKLSPQTIEGLLRQLGAPVDRVLLEPNLRWLARERRFKEVDGQTVAELASLGSFEALTAAVLLIAKSEAIASAPLRERAFEVYMALQPPIESMLELNGLAAELFLLIDTTCKHWVFPTSGSRLEIVIFTRELRNVDSVDIG